MFPHYPGFCLFSLLFILTPSLALCQESGKPPVDSANILLARRLLQAMHYDELLVAGIRSAMTQERPRNTQVPAIFYDSIVVRMQTATPELLDSLAPGYARRLTGAQLEAILEFYQSPTGQTFAREQAGLNVEAMQFGQRWAARVATLLIRDLKRAGVDIT